MKTLGKLNINSEKILKHEELKKLKGGWDGDCAIYHLGSYQEVKMMYHLEGSNASAIDADCAYHLGGAGSEYSCFCNYGE